MLTLLILVSYLLFTSYFFVQSVKYGMQSRRWIVGGMLMGPMLFPMFQISKQVALRKATGFDNLYIAA